MKDKSGNNRNDNKPEFKPGDTPHCVFGNEVLNGGIDWQRTLIDVLRHSPYTIERLAKILELKPQVLRNIISNNDTEGLYFRAGARLLTIHEKIVSQVK